MIVTKYCGLLVDLGIGGFGPAAAWANPENVQGAEDGNTADAGGAGSIANDLRTGKWWFAEPDIAPTLIRVKLHGSLVVGDGFEGFIYWQAARTSSKILSFGALGNPQDLASLGWITLGAGSFPTPAELAAGAFELAGFGEDAEWQLDAIQMEVTADFPATVAGGPSGRSLLGVGL